MVSLVASPTSGYRFISWTGNVGTIANGNAATTTITVKGDYSVTANFEEEEAVTFPDANLEAAIREAIGKPTGPICPSGPDGLTSLSASARSITDLTGLEHCTSLTNLLLQHNQISNISPLVNLTNLTHLRLQSNQINNISPLANLTSLTWLHLHSNQISGIEPLVNNTGLVQGDTVNLTINPLSDTSINTYIPQLQARGVTV